MSLTLILILKNVLLLTFRRYGIWKIEAKYKKNFVTSAVATFEVKEYGKVCPYCEPSFLYAFSVNFIEDRYATQRKKTEMLEVTLACLYTATGRSVMPSGNAGSS